MAWMKVDHDLHEKPEVAAIAAALGLNADTVVGKLLRVWRWFDKHTKDGCASVALMFVDEQAKQENFASEMQKVGWLITRKNNVVAIPKFDRHISKSAKNRGLAAERMKKSRCAAVVTKPSPEKRREEKKYIKPPLPPLNEAIQSIRTTIEHWLEYKSWRYTPRGYAALLTRFAKRLEQSGSDAVASAVDRAIAADYKSWDIDDWFKSKPTAPRLPTPEEDAEWKP